MALPWVQTYFMTPSVGTGGTVNPSTAQTVFQDSHDQLHRRAQRQLHAQRQRGRHLSSGKLEWRRLDDRPHHQQLFSQFQLHRNPTATTRRRLSHQRRLRLRPRPDLHQHPHEQLSNIGSALCRRQRLWALELCRQRWRHAPPVAAPRPPPPPPRRPSPAITPTPPSPARRSPSPPLSARLQAPEPPSGQITINADTGESCTAPVATGTCDLTFATAGYKTLSPRQLRRRCDLRRQPLRIPIPAGGPVRPGPAPGGETIRCAASSAARRRSPSPTPASWPRPANLPDGVNFPYGLFTFTVTGLPTSATSPSPSAIPPLCRPEPST